MVKVKNQVYDGSEESYIDADGEVHYFGDFFRHVLTDAYPLFSLNPVGVSRKSPRGYRRSQQGRGSPEQAPGRDCFQQCSVRWNSLPETSPEIGSCPEQSSKANVSAAKQLQGVRCSYFDLYMACCLSYCTTIEVSGPGGSSFKGGSIPSNENCWPTPSPCKSSDLEIGSSTQQMGAGESQELSADDSDLGPGVPCCPNGDISWEIIEGDGVVDPDSGDTIDYTAPEENVDCLGNPTIKVVDCCEREAEIKIAVNTDDGEDPAYSIDDGTCEIFCNATPPGYGQMCDAFIGYRRRFYTCAGVHLPALDTWYFSTVINTVLGSCGSDGYCMIVAQEWCTLNDGDDILSDLRDETQMSAGCCPAALL